MSLLFEIVIVLNVLGELYSHKAGMRAAMIAWRKAFAENASNFMLLGVRAIMNDAVNA